jgi:hypothetical protein
MKTNVDIRTIIDMPNLKVSVYTAECHGSDVAMKRNFLLKVREYVHDIYPGEPVNFYEEINTDLLSVVVIVGINTLSSEILQLEF